MDGWKFFNHWKYVFHISVLLFSLSNYQTKCQRYYICSRIKLRKYMFWCLFCPTNQQNDCWFISCPSASLNPQINRPMDWAGLLFASSSPYFLRHRLHHLTPACHARTFVCVCNCGGVKRKEDGFGGGREGCCKLQTNEWTPSSNSTAGRRDRAQGLPWCGFFCNVYQVHQGPFHLTGHC